MPKSYLWSSWYCCHLSSLGSCFCPIPFLAELSYAAAGSQLLDSRLALYLGTDTLAAEGCNHLMHRCLCLPSTYPDHVLGRYSVELTVKILQQQMRSETRCVCLLCDSQTATADIKPLRGAWRGMFALRWVWSVLGACQTRADLDLWRVPLEFCG